MIQYCFLKYKNVVAKLELKDGATGADLWMTSKSKLFFIDGEWRKDAVLELYLNDSAMMYDGESDDNYEHITEEQAMEIIAKQSAGSKE